MTREAFITKAKELIDNYPFLWGKLFEYDDFDEEMKVAHVLNGSDIADLPLIDFLNDLYEQIKEDLA